MTSFSSHHTLSLSSNSTTYWATLKLGDLETGRFILNLKRVGSIHPISHYKYPQHHLDTPNPEKNPLLPTPSGHRPCSSQPQLPSPSRSNHRRLPHLSAAFPISQRATGPACSANHRRLLHLDPTIIASTVAFLISQPPIAVTLANHPRLPRLDPTTVAFPLAFPAS
ncbi:hypothetical protein vseg_013345 [Gypsophila vaccaria]